MYLQLHKFLYKGYICAKTAPHPFKLKYIFDPQNQNTNQLIPLPSNLKFL